MSSIAVTNLQPGMRYYFVVQSVTDPHGNNANTVVSDRSPEVMGDTLPRLRRRLGAAGT